MLSCATEMSTLDWRLTDFRSFKFSDPGFQLSLWVATIRLSSLYFSKYVKIRSWLLSELNGTVDCTKALAHSKCVFCAFVQVKQSVVIKSSVFFPHSVGITEVLQHCWWSHCHYLRFHLLHTNEGAWLSDWVRQSNSTNDNLDQTAEPIWKQPCYLPLPLSLIQTHNHTHSFT